MLERAGIVPPGTNWTWDDLVSLASTVRGDPEFACQHVALVSTLGLLFFPGIMGGSIAVVDDSDAGMMHASSE